MAPPRWSIVFAVLFAVALSDAAPLPYVGVNLAGAEFGSNVPGTLNTDYTWPTTEEVNYFVSTKKMTIIRLPFRWERVQRSLNGAFDSGEQGRLDAAIQAITSRRAVVMLDPHNYARYSNNIIGSTQVPYSAFGDFWTRLANLYKNNPLVWFNLMNEPKDMPTEQWRDAAQAAIYAIRETGATNKILVPGNGYTGAHSWFSTWYGSANAIVMLNITDPGNNMVYEVHQYLDGDSSGTDQSGTCVSTTIGAERLTQFTNWLKTNNKKGFLGEFAGGNNAQCRTAIEGMINYMETNSDVWIGWTWWAAGPWWGPTYMFTLEPTNNFQTDAAQMAWLASHIPSSNPPVSVGAPFSITPSPVASTAPFTVSTGNSLQYTGVNLAGAEFGESTMPGVYNTHYTYPTVDEIIYFVSTKKMNIIRVPFRWERIQRSLNGTFDVDEKARLDAVVQAITSRNAVALIDPHNYARYTLSGTSYIIGSSAQLTNGHFADFWTRLANAYKSNSRVWFGLMNEPHDMPTEQWRLAAQTAIDAIRSAGATNKILVPGNAYTGAHSWTANYYGTANSAEMIKITDPGNNFAFEVHQYLDSDNSGTTEVCVSTTVGVERLTSFTNWLKSNNKKAFLGEFAGGNNQVCRTAVTGMINYMQQNSDVWIGWSWWAAGPWWSNYRFTLEPTSNPTTDSPFMSWLSPFIGIYSQPTAGPVANSSPSPVNSRAPSANSSPSPVNSHAPSASGMAVVGLLAAIVCGLFTIRF